MSQATDYPDGIFCQIESLRRQNRWIKTILLGLLCVPLCFLIMGQASPERIIEGSKFVLKDENGKMRARLFMNEGGASLAFYDAAGKGQAALAVGPDGPLLYFYSTKGVEILKLTTIDDSPVLALADSSGTVRVQAGVTKSAAHVLINNLQGGPAVGMGVDQAGPVLSLRDSNGTVRGRLTVDSKETKLAFADAQADRLVLSMSADESGLTLFDNNQKQRAALATKREGTIFGLSDSFGKVRALLGEANGGAQLTIINQNGKIVATVPK